MAAGSYVSPWILMCARGGDFVGVVADAGRINLLLFLVS